MGNKAPSLADTVMNVKIAAKQLEAQSRRSEKDEKKEREKVKKAIEKGNKEGAQIYAQNAIRKKHEAINYLKLSSKMDAVASRLDSAEKSQQLTRQISTAVPQLEKALSTMSVEAMATNMEQFEKIFEDLDVRAEYMNNAIDQTTATTTPANEVDALITQVGEEHSLEVTGMLQQTPLEAPQVGAPRVAAQPVAAAAEPQPVAAGGGGDDDLEKRLAQLRGD